MASKGRPPAKALRSYRLTIRLNDPERETLYDAANLAGSDLADWARQQLLRSARNDLEAANLQVPYIQAKKEGLI